MKMKSALCGFLTLFVMVANTQPLIAKAHHKNCIPITAKEINQPGGFLITEPGVYCLKEDDFHYNPATDGDINAPIGAITISSDDVYLNLKKHTISQKTSSTTNNNFGIVVTANHKNITIANGTLENISGCSVLVKDGCQNIVINKIKTYKSGIRGNFQFAPPLVGTSFRVTAGYAVLVQGIPANRCEDIVINNSQFEYSTGVNNSFTITLVDTVNIKMNNLLVDNSSCSFFNAGIHILRTNAVNVSNCLLKGLFAGFNLKGILSEFSNGLNVTNSTFADFTVNGQIADELEAMEIFTNNGVLVKECTASNFNMTSALTSTTVFPPDLTTAPHVFCMGIFFDFNSNNYRIEDCTVTNLTLTSTAVSSSDNIFQVDGIVTRTTPAASGTVLFNAGVKNCYVSGLNTNKGFATGYNAGFAGFQIANPPASQALTGTGFVLQDCVAENIVCAAVPSQASGILLYNQIKAVVENNVVTNTGGIGIWVHGPYPNGSRQCMIQNNTVSSNGSVGILDDTAATSLHNMYAGNHAYNNGPSGAVNYSGLPAFTPQPVWNLSAGPLPVSTAAPTLDNWDVRP